MKKFSKYFVAAAIVVAATAAVLVGCKKEKDEPNGNGRQSEAAVLVNRINNFLEMRDALKAGTKSSGSMTVEEMRQILDLTTNYEHSNHMTYCLNTVLDTMYFAMPRIDVNGCVSEADVVKVYDAFEVELEKKMLAVNDAMDIPSYFSIVMPEIETKDGDIRIIFSRGEASDEEDGLGPAGPFGIGDCYKWGMGLGHCPPDSTARRTDAAMELSRLFKFDRSAMGNDYVLLLSNVEYVTYTPYAYPYGNMTYWEPTVTPSCADRWLYCICGEFEEEPCICWEELNCYYYNVNQFVVHENGPLHNSPIYNSPYFECSFKGAHLYNPQENDPQKRSVRIHALTVTYAGYQWYNQHQME